MKKCITILLGLTALWVWLPALAMAHTDVTPQEAQELIESTPSLIIVDVREESEFCDENGHIPCSLNYPWNSGVLQERYEELPIDGDILIVCRSGARSNMASDFLDSKGFTSVYDMTGGMSAWEGERITCAEEESCPAKVVLCGNQLKLEKLRQFRNEVLLNSTVGTALTMLYYYYAAEITDLLRRHPELRILASEIAEAVIPVIED